MDIGIVLSGGFARGAYQVGVLKALGDFIPASEIKRISCASIGALNGYAYVTGKLDIAEEMWKNICCGSARNFLGQMLRSGLLQQKIDTIYNKNDSFPYTFYCSLSDIIHRKVVYKDLSTVPIENIPLYLRASIALPGYYRAVNIDNTPYFDGGIIDNIPIFPLLKHKLDYVICVYFDDTSYKFENAYFDNKVIKITFPGKGLLKESLLFDKESIIKMINEGYERANDIFSSVLRNGYDDIDYIYKTIECKNRNEVKSLRVTSDVLITNLNKVVQKFAKRKII